MRTTLTLDDDLARRLKDTARLTGKTFKEVVNATLRRGFGRGELPAATLPPFKIGKKARGLRPGIDPLKFNQLVDELAVEDFLEKVRKEAEQE
ncbi:MAG: DUF2191 domain-containing protein [Acidobacteriota bacterium]